MELDEVLCLKHRRVVGNDNCVSYKGMRLQVPPVEDRYHFVRAKVEVREYGDGSMAIYHGKRRVGSYDSEGRLKRVRSNEQRQGPDRRAPQFHISLFRLRPSRLM